MSQLGARSDIELHDLPARTELSQEPSNTAAGMEELQDVNGQSLPPYDGGRAAWSLLLAAFVFEALLWGPTMGSVKAVLDFATILLLTTSNRLSIIIRRLPGLLLSATPIPKRPLYLCNWHDSIWYIVYGCTDRHSSHQALFQVQEADDMCRLLVLLL